MGDETTKKDGMGVYLPTIKEMGCYGYWDFPIGPLKTPIISKQIGFSY